METQAAEPSRAPIPSVAAATPLPEPLPTKLERLHAEALEALRLVMTKALDSITTLPPPTVSDTDTDEPAQSPADHARTVTQRMRLALTAARDLLRYTTETDTESPSPNSAGDRAFRSNAHERRKSSSDAQLHSNSSSEGQTSVPSDAQSNGADPETHQRGTQDRNPIALSPPRDSSLVTHTSPPPPRLTPNYPPIPPKPLYRRPGPVVVPAHFTNDEIDLFEETLRTKDPFPKPLYRRLIEWRVHCNDYYLQYPLPITHEALVARNPWKKERTAQGGVNKVPPDTA